MDQSNNHSEYLLVLIVSRRSKSESCQHHLESTPIADGGGSAGTARRRAEAVVGLSFQDHFSDVFNGLVIVFIFLLHYLLYNIGGPIPIFFKIVFTK